MGTMAKTRRRTDRDHADVGRRRPERVLPRDRREDDDAEGHADDPDGDLEQGEGDGVARDGALAERRRQRSHDDERDLRRPEPERAWCQEGEHPAAGPVREVHPDRRPEPQPDERGQLDQEVPGRPGTTPQARAVTPIVGPSTAAAAMIATL
jgi:hypothetical protein